MALGSQATQTPYQAQVLSRLAISPTQAFNQAQRFAPPAPPPSPTTPPAAPQPQAAPTYSVQFGNMKFQFPSMALPATSTENPTGLGPKGDRGVYTPTPAAAAYAKKMSDQLIAQSNAMGAYNGNVYDMPSQAPVAGRSVMRRRVDAADTLKNQEGRASLLIQR
jgi:hypothetical protein